MNEGLSPIPYVSIRQIQEAVSRSFRIPPIEMISARRARDVSRPRQVAMYLARELTCHSLPRIGYYFGDRDHTTVMHGIREVKKRIGTDIALRQRIVRLKRRLRDSGKRVV